MAAYIIDNPEEVKEVVALDINGNYVGRYPNASDADFKLSLPTPTVTNCLSGKTYTSKGYIFLYADQYDKGKRITLASLKRRRAFLKQKK